MLFFHRVLRTRDPLAPHEPTASQFEATLDWLQSQLAMLPLDEAVRRLAEGTLPPAAACISFDDGYADNAEVAAPLLGKHGIPATFFVSSSFLDGGIMWNDVVVESLRATSKTSLTWTEAPGGTLPLRDWSERLTAVNTVLATIKYEAPDRRLERVERLAAECGVAPPRTLMMRSEQVRGLAAKGFGIGAHTHSHPILSRLPDSNARDEIRVGRDRLEAIVDAPVPLFAYPNGRAGDDFDERHARMVESLRFAAAFTTDGGVARPTSDRFRLPRFTPWSRTQWRFRAQLVGNMSR